MTSNSGFRRQMNVYQNELVKKFRDTDYKNYVLLNRDIPLTSHSYHIETLLNYKGVKKANRITS